MHSSGHKLAVTYNFRQRLLAAVITNEKTSKEKCDAMVSNVTRSPLTTLLLELHNCTPHHGFSALFGVCSIDGQSTLQTHSADVLQRSYGGEVIVAPSGVPADHPDHYQNLAVTLCKQHADYFDVDQYDNPNNPEAYYRSLGPEVCLRLLAPSLLSPSLGYQHVYFQFLRITCYSA